MKHPLVRYEGVVNSESDDQTHHGVVASGDLEHGGLTVLLGAISKADTQYIYPQDSRPCIFSSTLARTPSLGTLHDKMPFFPENSI